MRESISPREVCSILKSLCERAENTRVELELSVSDTILRRREAGIENYKKYLDTYNEHYKNSKDKLLHFITTDTLLDFIIEQAISNPMMLVDLAKALNVEGGWDSYPIREIRDPQGKRYGY